MTGNVWIHRYRGPRPKWWQELLTGVAFIVGVTVLVFIPLLVIIQCLIHLVRP